MDLQFRQPNKGNQCPGLLNRTIWIDDEIRHDTTIDDNYRTSSSTYTIYLVLNLLC